MSQTPPAEKVDAWMPLWIGSYLADTMTLTTQQHGAYLLLLIAYWRNRGPLDDDDEGLASITKASTSEWKKLRAKLQRFFTISDGKWSHGRADKELVSAGLRKAAASSKAKAAAEARWKKHPSNAPSDPSGNAPSITAGNAHALPEDCPTPSPSPSNTTDGAVQPPTAGARDSVLPTAVGRVCLALRRAGISTVNHSSPRLHSLIDAGATVDEFLAHVPKALQVARDPFVYVLGAVEGERTRAATTAKTLHQGPLPDAQTAVGFRERDANFAASEAARLTGGLVGRTAPAPAPQVIDITPRMLENPHARDA